MRNPEHCAGSLHQRARYGAGREQLGRVPYRQEGWQRVVTEYTCIYKKGLRNADRAVVVQ